MKIDPFTKVILIVVACGVVLAIGYSLISGSAAPSPSPSASATMTSATTTNKDSGEPRPPAHVTTDSPTTPTTAPTTTPATNWQEDALTALKEDLPIWGTLPLKDGSGDVNSWKLTIKKLPHSSSEFINKSSTTYGTIWGGALLLGAYTANVKVTAATLASGDSAASSWKVTLKRDVKIPDHPELDTSETTHWLIGMTGSASGQQLRSYEIV